METILRGTPTLRAIDVAARGSVGETIAPSTNAAAHGSPTRVCATTPTISVVARTRPVASRVICLTFDRTSRREVKNAAA